MDIVSDSLNRVSGSLNRVSGSLKRVSGGLRLTPRTCLLAGIIALAIALAGCTAPGSGSAATSEVVSPSSTAEAPPQYTANSWRELIADSCRSFYDGCNQCRRADGASEAACTRRACLRYEQPRCLDPMQNAEPVTTYQCGDRTLDVLRHQYTVAGQTETLADNQVALHEHNSASVDVLSRSESASGEKFTSGNMQFWSKGNEATWMLGSTRLQCSRR